MYKLREPHILRIYFCLGGWVARLRLSDCSLVSGCLMKGKKPAEKTGGTG